MNGALAYSYSEPDYDRLLLRAVEYFLPHWFAYTSGEEAADDIAPDFGIAGKVPLHALHLMERIMALYTQHLDPAAAEELLAMAHRLGQQGYELDIVQELREFLDSPADEYADPHGESADAAFMATLPALYTLHAVARFNQMLPDLQRGGLEAVSGKAWAELQQAVDHAETAVVFAQMLERFKDYQPPKARIAQSLAGGHACAAKYYGATKDYVKRRVREIRARGSAMSKAQIAQKIAYELAQNPIAGDEPLSNPYDTIYRWVRAVDKPK